MCEWGTWLGIQIKIPAEQSFTGMDRWKLVKIDNCIADLVAALQNAGIDMRGSCCGHDQYPGCILLRDGRVLILTDERRARKITLLLESICKN